MKIMARKAPSPDSTAKAVFKIVTTGSDRVFTNSDFAHLPRAAVSLALSRLAKQGELKRISRGVYYRARQTIVGSSKAGQGAIELSLLQGARPSGLSAASLLGFSTQQPAKPTYAIPQRDAVTRVKGVRMIRQRANHDLSSEDGALLEFIRDRAKWSELTDSATLDKLKTLCMDQHRYERLAKAALTEPPRVRAILGAIGELSGVDAKVLKVLADSLNPTSKFDFGRLAFLPNAKSWRAK